MYSALSPIDNVEPSRLQQIYDDDEIERIIDQIISEHPDQVTAYKGGKDKLFGFFVGQIMKATQRKANPASANKILKDKLDN